MESVHILSYWSVYFSQSLRDTSLYHHIPDTIHVSIFYVSIDTLAEVGLFFFCSCSLFCFSFFPDQCWTMLVMVTLSCFDNCKHKLQLFFFLLPPLTFYTGLQRDLHYQIKNLAGAVNPLQLIREEHCRGSALKGQRLFVLKINDNGSSCMRTTSVFVIICFDVAMSRHYRAMVVNEENLLKI